MVGKFRWSERENDANIPIWLEKVRWFEGKSDPKFLYGLKIPADRRGKGLKKFRYGWKKSDMVGKLLRIEEGNN